MKKIEQKIAALEAQLAREKSRLSKEKRARETGQKVILGGMLISMAREDPRMREWLINQVKQRITREIDQKRLQPILEELGAIPAGNGADRAREGV